MILSNCPFILILFLIRCTFFSAKELLGRLVQYGENLLENEFLIVLNFILISILDSHKVIALASEHVISKDQ